MIDNDIKLLEDEIDIHVEQFNTMVDAIKFTNVIISKANKDLSREVVDHTSTFVCSESFNAMLDKYNISSNVAIHSESSMDPRVSLSQMVVNMEGFVDSAKNLLATIWEKIKLAFKKIARLLGVKIEQLEKRIAKDIDEVKSQSETAIVEASKEAMGDFGKKYPTVFIDESSLHGLTEKLANVSPDSPVGNIDVNLTAGDGNGALSAVTNKILLLEKDTPELIKFILSNIKLFKEKSSSGNPTIAAEELKRNIMAQKGKINPLIGFTKTSGGVFTIGDDGKVIMADCNIPSEGVDTSNATPFTKSNILDLLQRLQKSVVVISNLLKEYDRYSEGSIGDFSDKMLDDGAKDASSVSTRSQAEGQNKATLAIMMRAIAGLNTQATRLAKDSIGTLILALESHFNKVKSFGTDDLDKRED